jgi:flagellar export protein FliJ
MKSFRFRLQRALELRESEARKEEAELERLWTVRRGMEAERDALAAGFERMNTVVRAKPFLHPSELVALDRYKDRYQREQKQGNDKLAAQDAAIEGQKRRVIAARGRVKLLEKLRQKRQEEWQAESDRELEEVAADFSAAQWLRERGA